MVRRHQHGQSGSLAAPGKGAICAIASDGKGRFFFATRNKQIWRFPGVRRPIYTAARPITDIALGNVDLASLIRYGKGCACSNGLPTFRVNNAPSRGDRAFKMQVDGVRRAAAAALVLGTSRLKFAGGSLPFGFDAIGMPGCKLYTSIRLSVPTTTSAAGVASVPLPVPNLAFKGAHFMGQLFVLHKTANRLGLVSSDGAEGIVR